MKAPKLSVVVTVFNSHEIVRRQLLYFERVLPREAELILVDDGSEPSLKAVCASVPTTFRFTLHLTNDKRPWTQTAGRNIGVKLARADRLLLFDIDHILSDEILQMGLTSKGNKVHWTRRPAILDEDGKLVTDHDTLVDYGMVSDKPSVHVNSFFITKRAFEMVGGYDEWFCERYGGSDIDFNKRYDKLVLRGKLKKRENKGNGYIFPRPEVDVKKLFHSLSRIRPPGY